jgi:GDPmannose 4,6-dehydratase
MAKRAFITGITGQDGSYLARLLLKKGYQVHGGQRRTSTSATGRLDELGIADDITIHDLDLIEVTNIQRVLDKVAPDEIYNLAAQRRRFASALNKGTSANRRRPSVFWLTKP